MIAKFKSFALRLSTYGEMNLLMSCGGLNRSDPFTMSVVGREGTKEGRREGGGLLTDTTTPRTFIKPLILQRFLRPCRSLKVAAYKVRVPWFDWWPIEPRGRGGIWRSTLLVSKELGVVAHDRPERRSMSVKVARDE
jgi:hypothetical protein